MTEMLKFYEYATNVFVNCSLAPFFWYIVSLLKCCWFVISEISLLFPSVILLFGYKLWVSRKKLERKSELGLRLYEKISSEMMLVRSVLNDMRSETLYLNSISNRKNFVVSESLINNYRTFFDKTTSSYSDNNIISHCNLLSIKNNIEGCLGYVAKHLICLEGLVYDKQDSLAAGQRYMKKELVPCLEEYLNHLEELSSSAKKLALYDF